MKVLFLPFHIDVLVFDIDQTLYRNNEYIRQQNFLTIAEQARKEGRTYQELEEQIKTMRREHKNKFGQFLPLGKVLEQMGTSLEVSSQWFERLFKPENYLKRDELLVATLKQLVKGFSMAAVTNNSGSIGLRVLQCLGVRDFFTSIVGIEKSGEFKPSLMPFEIVADELGVEFSQMVSIGDKDVDVYQPVQEGMGGIIVESMQDVYCLPKVLLPSSDVDLNTKLD